MSKTRFAIVGLILFPVLMIVFSLATPNMEHAFAYVLDLYDFTFSNTILQNNLVLVEFWNPDCPHCIQIVDRFEMLSEEYGDLVTFARLNVNDYPSISEYYQVYSTPTFMLFENGYPPNVIGSSIEDVEAVLLEMSMEQSQLENWSLKVTVNNIPTDVSNVIVTVKGPFNEYTSQSFHAYSPNMYTIFSIPYDKIPDGHEYKVCIRETSDRTDWCSTYAYNGIPSVDVSVNWPLLSESLSSGNSVCPISFTNTQATGGSGSGSTGSETCDLPCENFDILIPSRRC